MENNPLIPVLSNAGVSEKIQGTIIPVVSTYLTELERWKSLAQVEVKDHTDKKGMKLADENRREIKRKRNEAKSFLTSKRDEVKIKMETFKQEDTAYLRIIQYFEEKGKELEDNLEFQAKTAERYEVQRLDDLERSRTEVIKSLGNNPEIYPLRSMPEEGFEELVSGIIAKKDLERIQKEKETAFQNRKQILDTYTKYGVDISSLSVDSSEEDFSTLYEKAKEAKKEVEEQEKIAVQKQETFQKRKEEMTPYFSLQYEGKGTITKDSTEEEYQLVLSAAKEAHKIYIEEQNKLAAFEAKRKRMFALGFSFNGESFIFGTIIVPESDVKVDSFNPDTFDEQIKGLKAEIEKENEKKRQESLKLEKMNLFNVRSLAWKDLEKFSDRKLTVDTTEEEYKAMLEEAVANELKQRPVDIASWVELFKAPEKLTTNLEEDTKKVDEILRKFEGFKKWARSL